MRRRRGQISALLRQHDPIGQTTIEVANYIDTLEETIDMYGKIVAILLFSNTLFVLVVLVLVLYLNGIL